MSIHSHTPTGGAMKSLLWRVIVLALVMLPGASARAVPVPPSTRLVSASPADTVVVTTTSDTVDGNTSSFTHLNSQRGSDNAISFREALLSANATPTATLALTITFAIPATDSGYNSATQTWTIRVGSVDSSGLPPLARGNLRIQGSSTLVGASYRPAIVLDGIDNWDEPANGLQITSANNLVRGLTIANFYHNGIEITGGNAANNQIAGCFIGADPTGINAQPNGTGINLAAGAHDNLIGGRTAADRNIISGNDYEAGVRIQNTGTASNTLVGNWIGLNSTGLASLSNGWAGVYINGGAHHTMIGGSTDAERNIIAGNNADGIWIEGDLTAHNTVAGNWIGVDMTGNAALANASAGVYLSAGTHDNQIGVVHGNLISGNESGVQIRGSKANRVAGNTIGLAANGKTELGNRDAGIYIIEGANENVIGGPTPADRNIISGNGNAATSHPYGNGIHISDPQTTHNLIQGNYIGVTASGILPAGNAGYGVLVSTDADDNTIGDNVITYNAGGVWLNSSNNTLAHNLIGIGADRATHLGNQFNGVRISGHNNTIGPENLIAFNQHSGIKVNGSNTEIISNTLTSNSRSGLCIESTGTQVYSNTITNNGNQALDASDCGIQGGVVITGTGDIDTKVVNNTILANRGAGITVRAGTKNRINANSISDNDEDGIALLEDGNENRLPPQNMRISATAISGTSCAECRIELFTDSNGEGRYFIGAVNADEKGAFSLAINTAKLSPPYVTATSTDEFGNTSPFTLPLSTGQNPPPAKHLLWLPAVRGR